MVRGDDISLGSFFKSRQYYIPGYDDIKDIHTPEELSNTVKVANECEIYDITHKPMPPRFPLPEGVTASEKLRERCREGWVKRWPLIKKVIKKTNHTKQEYVDRLEMELSVLEGAELADYFLIVDDIIRFARKDGQLTGAGRGSADGSLVIYLLEVGHLDPIEHDLMFERFYNAGRNTAGRVSLPDVDMDFEKRGRERIIKYLRTKYGQDKVAQMITFTKMQGRSSLQDVLRAHAACNPEERNKITSNIPDEAEISDQLELMRKQDKESGGDGDASIIQWALENRPDDFKQWCHIDKEGKLQGTMSKLFEQAIRLEGTKRSASRHPAGIVIANKPLHQICPMVYDKSTGEMIAGMDMNDLESMGHIKFDILGIAVLDKIHGVQDLLMTGELK
jgi:DNA polymerase-3 subunit alpha